MNDIDPNVTSLIFQNKEEFERKLKTSLATDAICKTVLKSVPVSEVEKQRINSPGLKEKLKEIISPLAYQMVETYDKIGTFNTGSMFSSTISSIFDSVSMESKFRTDKLENDLRLGKVSCENVNINKIIADRYEKLNWSNPEIERNFVNSYKAACSTEALEDQINEIKEQVKNDIEETEAKNEIVETANEEIVKYKEEIAPPEDTEYQDPNDPNAGNILEDNEEGMGEGEEGEGTDDLGDGEENAVEDLGNEEGMEEGENGAENLDDEEGMGEGEEGEGTDDLGDDEGTDSGEGFDDTGLDEEGMGEGEEGTDDLGDGDVMNDETSQQQPPINIVINTGSGANIKATKEHLNLLNAEKFAEKYVPMHARLFDKFELPNKNVFASEAYNASIRASNPSTEFFKCMNSLDFAIRSSGLDKVSINNLLKKKKEYEELSQEAFSKRDFFEKNFDILNISQESLLNDDESTMIIARNIIGRFLLGTKKVSRTPLPYTSKENVLANVFDIVQLRQYCMESSNPENAAVEDLFARESLFYKNKVDIADKDLAKKAEAVINLSDFKFIKGMSPNFISDYQIKAHEINMSKSNPDTNAEITGRIAKRLKEKWGRVSEDELKIIEAITNQEDPTEIIPNPHEKFVITLAKESAIANSNVSLESNFTSAVLKLNKKQKDSVKLNAKILTALYYTAESAGLVEKDSYEKFIEDYIY